MKGCLVVIGFVVLAAAVAVGVVVLVQRGGDADDEALTRQATRVEVVATTPDSRGTPPNEVAGSIIDYEYETGGRRFESSTWVSSAARPDGTLHICLDPTDPAVHTVRLNPRKECGERGLGSDGVRRAEQVAS